MQRMGTPFLMVEFEGSPIEQKSKNRTLFQRVPGVQPAGQGAVSLAKHTPSAVSMG